MTDAGGEHPYMDKYWVPGLQIGYEHSFVNHVADFLESVAKGTPDVLEDDEPDRVEGRRKRRGGLAKDGRG